MKLRTTCIVALSVLLSGCATSSRDAASAWRTLFDGTTLSGWTQRGGKAAYKVEDQCIVGETRPNQANSFLCTDESFADFELTYEFKVDPKLNSGVQIRSESKPEYKSGVVFGYQVEIDPSERAWTAGIYDESRRGWLANLEKNPEARAAFKQNEWNSVRVLAVGDHIQTWLNGVPAADLHDSMTASGFIGLQVHSVGASGEVLQVRWRAIRLRDLSGMNNPPRKQQSRAARPSNGRGVN